MSAHHFMLLLGTGSLSWCGHQVHVALPINRFLDSGVEPNLLPWPQDLMFSLAQQLIFHRFGTLSLADLSYYLPKGVSMFSLMLNSSTGSVFLGISVVHHLYLAATCVVVSSVLSTCQSSSSLTSIGYYVSTVLSALQSSNHGSLATSLLVTSQLSMVYAHYAYAVPIYPYLAADYPTVLSLFVHHLWIAGSLTCGAGTHVSIFVVRDLNIVSFSIRYDKTRTTLHSQANQVFFFDILNHRCIVIGHLAYACVFLGLHSFGFYVHNDTMQSLSRPADMFSDNALQLKPVFAIFIQSLSVTYNVNVLDTKLITFTQELGTADFLVHHVHAFTIHVTLLILLKGMLFARSSRLIADKADLGFRYPCDGPGRGGTCQISPWDHVFLAAFWMYNLVSVVVFHFSWKLQSDVWGTFNLAKSTAEHISSGDFSVNSSTVNGWLRNYLWSQAAQVIQSYGSPLSSYGLMFLLAHFIWAFSLMFLFSGRGYWQELIESCNCSSQAQVSYRYSTSSSIN